MSQKLFKSNTSTKSIHPFFASLLLVIAISGLLIWRLFSFISRYAVNILYYDQLAFLFTIIRL